ncbi:delta-aminolevulinic acid dehydratase [Gordonibacter massiliensis (ex Traore et al. 2017)]|uniref:delta-aminolevulinic acid dehydratase n=1 Tax=Gordonibacter massiliensis (ex Traore et al. 2017) TaxID=1841863 RepID=UPI0009AF98B6|nr:delta-aminolevulinic acid dehydratase [Gordonibacter massiliensis (ex Traore et al. 2017)]MBX9032993.1 delta-aminolevulinic acid dehydratase [Gordonibacter massiliensis (ex Traore et al. 2017)]
MGMAALAEPLAIKISSKRQITIPAKAYEEAGFKDYALCTWTDKGMFLQPLDVEDEDATIDILRYLISEGYEGEDLITQYKVMKKKVVSVKDKIDEAERDIAEGRVGSAREMQKRMREKYGLYDQ